MQLQTTQPTTLDICNTQIRRDHAGRYCLNDLHKAAIASGVTKDIRPNEWLSLEQTGNLAEVLITEKPGNTPIESKAGRYGGTYVCKELVYAYAMWISAAFHLKVIRAFDALVSAPPQQINPAELSRMQLIELAMQAETERIALEGKVVEMTPKVRVTAKGLARLAEIIEKEAA